MRKFACVLVMTLATGCARTPPPCQTVVKCSLDQRFTPTERTEIRAAMHLWERGARNGVSFREGGRADLFVYRGTADDFRPFVRGAGFYEAITVFPSIVIMAPDRFVGDSTVRSVAAHEIGHYLGIEHLDTRNSVMHAVYGTLRDGRLWPADIEAYRDTHPLSCVDSRAR